MLLLLLLLAKRDIVLEELELILDLIQIKKIKK